MECIDSCHHFDLFDEKHNSKNKINMKSSWKKSDRREQILRIILMISHSFGRQHFSFGYLFTERFQLYRECLRPNHRHLQNIYFTTVTVGDYSYFVLSVCADAIEIDEYL